MRAKLILAALLMTTAVGCGRLADSKINPFNWFGRSQEVAADTGGQAQSALMPSEARSQIQDPRPMIDQITELRIDRTPGGGILRATGVTPSLGYYEAELVKVPSDRESVLNYEYRIMPPEQVTQVGSTAARRVTTAIFLSEQDLAGIREVRVRAARNARSTRR